MQTHELIGTLRALRFSAALPESTLRSLASVSNPAHFEPGATLFQEGSLHSMIYLVERGLVAIEMNVPGRGRTRLLTLGPGDVVAWSSLLGDGRMTATAVAIEPTDAIAAPSEALRNLCQADHEFGYHLMRQMAVAMSQRLAATRLQLLDLFGDAAPAIPAAREDQP